MKTSTLLFILCFSFTTSLNAQVFDLQLEELFVIGKESSDTTEYLFRGIRTVSVLGNGKILIGDSGEAAIKIFDQKGRYVSKIGQRGRGPGDFNEVTFISSFEDNTFAVVDRIQNRISQFDADGELVSSVIPSKNAMGTMQFIFRSALDNKLILAYRDYLNSEKNGHFLHVFDSSLLQEEEEYFDLFDLFFDKSIPFENRLSTSPRYHATSFGNNQIAIAPTIFTGTIGVFNMSAFKSSLIGSEIQNSYKLYDWEKRNEIRKKGTPGVASISGQSDKFFYGMKGSTFGLVGNSKFLLHFYALFENNSIKPYLYIYSDTGKCLASIPLDNPIIRFPENTLSFRPLFLDENNILYVQDYYYGNSYPGLIALRTNLSVLFNKADR